jgi:hypothetical protein
MRNNLDQWLKLLRIGTFLTLLAAAWNIIRTHSPLGIKDQFLPVLQDTTGKFLNPSTNETSLLTEPQQYITYAFAAFFIIAALASFRCGIRKKLKYTLPISIAGTLMLIAAAKYYIDSHFELISIFPCILPIATPFLLLGYRRLANKLDHWNYYASFLCVTTIFGNALTFLFYPEKFPHFQESIFTIIGLPIASGQMAMTIISYTVIFSAFLACVATTRRLGLIALITIGALTCTYRLLALTFSQKYSLPLDLIFTDLIFHTSYWLIPFLILMSLASRRKTQTLKI